MGSDSIQEYRMSAQPDPDRALCPASQLPKQFFGEGVNRSAIVPGQSGGLRVRSSLSPAAYGATKSAM